MKCLGLPLIIASLTAGFAAPATASIPTETTQQWLDECSTSEMVTRRINRLSVDEVAKAAGLLRRAGLFPAFSQLTTSEGCLTLAATAASNAPAMVVNIERPPGYGREIERKLAEATQARLEQLDIGYSIPDPEIEAGSPMLELYRARPKDAKKAHWQTLTSELRVDNRSITGTYKGHCVILHDTSSFGQFVSRRLKQPLDNHFTNSDRAWLADNGARMEFWHEVSHCEQNALKTYEGPHGEGGLDDSTDPAAAVPAEDAGVDVTQLAGTSGASQCPMTESAFASDNPDEMASPTLTSESRKDISVGFLSRLSSEVEADLFAQDAIAQRFETGQPGCRDFRDVANLDPWGKFRLSMSMLNPQFHYMTWLNPWLHNLDTLQQMQVALEAWEANMNVGFDQLSIPHQSPLVRRIALRQAEVGVWNVAGHEADRERVSNWEAWLARPFKTQKYTH